MEVISKIYKNPVFGIVVKLDSGKEVKISLTHKAISKKILNGEHYRYRLNISVDRKSICFPYHDSIWNYEKRIPISEDNIKDAIIAVISDVDSYIESSDYSDFCVMFGYEENSESRKIYNLCKEFNDKLYSIFDDEEINELDRWGKGIND